MDSRQWRWNLWSHDVVTASLKSSRGALSSLLEVVVSIGSRHIAHVSVIRRKPLRISKGEFVVN